MITITLDTNCFEEKYNAELEELKKLRVKGEIEVLVYLEAYDEKKQYEASSIIKSKIKRAKGIAKMMGFTLDIYAKEIPDDKTIDDVLSCDRGKYNEIFKKVREIHSPEFGGDKFKNFKDLSLKKQINKLNDWRMLSLHISDNRDIFVTNDLSGFIRESKSDKDDKKKKRFESEFSGLHIRRLDNFFLEELKAKTDS